MTRWWKLLNIFIINQLIFPMDAPIIIVEELEQPIREEERLIAPVARRTGPSVLISLLQAHQKDVGAATVHARNTPPYTLHHDHHSLHTREDEAYEQHESEPLPGVRMNLEQRRLYERETDLLEAQTPPQSSQPKDEDEESLLSVLKKLFFRALKNVFAPYQ
jgi:hypothetical protein